MYPHGEALCIAAQWAGVQPFASAAAKLALAPLCIAAQWAGVQPCASAAAGLNVSQPLTRTQKAWTKLCFGDLWRSSDGLVETCGLLEAC